MITQSTARANPTHYRFRLGEGYKLLGEPRMPSVVVAPASACEVDAEPGTTHAIQPPNGGDPVTMRWIGAGRWEPIPMGVGRRLAYSAEYLAACGWTYAGAA